MSKIQYRLCSPNIEECKRLKNLGFPTEKADLSPFHIFLCEKEIIPCWSITRIVDILENNGVKVSYEDKSWCLKTIIENGKRHCFVGGSLPKLVIEMLESKIVKLK